VNQPQRLFDSERDPTQASSVVLLHISRWLSVLKSFIR